MTAAGNAHDHDFAARQYATLIASGLDEATVRERLTAVLGEWSNASEPRDSRSAASTQAEHMARLADHHGGDRFAARATFAAAMDNARLFALDWWRPIRSFVAYAVLLLLLAIVVVSFFMVQVLPAFQTLDAATGVGHHGAAAWLLSWGGLRMFLPWLAAVAVLIAFTLLTRSTRRAVANLRPALHAWLYGASSGQALARVRQLEQTSALARAGVATDDMAAALREHRRQGPRQHRSWKHVEARLEKARQLGTFEAELAWQRREAWSHMQTCLELGRDRLILLTRILFYVFIGYLIATLYLPIFTMANHVGVHIP